MNRSIALFSLVILFITGQAQRFQVDGFREDPSDISAIRHEQQDVNGYKCAIIKVRSNIEGLQFDSNLGITASEYKPGEAWLWVSPGERFLKFIGQGIIAKDYRLPQRIEASKVYILELLAAEVADSNERTPDLQWLIITSNPEGADLYINERLSGKTPFQRELPVGDYTWELRTEHYQTQTGKLNLKPGDHNRETLHISLSPNYGILDINSVPESGASISINGINLQLTTPANIDKIPPGQVRITLSLKDYETTNRSVEIAAGETLSLEMEMQPRYSLVNISTTPHSDIFINYQHYGHGVWQGRLNAGIHTFEARKENHHPATEQREIEIGQTTEIALTPEPITGNLRIVSNPVGARIFINKQDHGTAPKTIRDLLIGNHQLALTYDHHQPMEKTILINENQTTDVSEVLMKEEDILKTRDLADNSTYGMPSESSSPAEKEKNGEELEILKSRASHHSGLLATSGTLILSDKSLSFSPSKLEVFASGVTISLEDIIHVERGRGIRLNRIIIHLKEGGNITFGVMNRDEWIKKILEHK